MLRETGIDGLTAVRGAIGNPWIFKNTQALLEGRPLPDPPSLFEQARSSKSIMRCRTNCTAKS
ncbi:MAG: tRNA-dihydrouridine synthase [Pirellulales bacterium]